MSNATIYTLKNADFSGQGLPSIFPFVAQTEAEFAYDFRTRANRLNDLTGRHADLVPKRQDIVGGVTRVVDPTIVVDQDAGAGIRLELGYLETDIACPTIPIDGSVQFSILVVGGYSGVAFPSNKVAMSNALLANLLDFGTSISSSSSFCFDDKPGSAPPMIGNRIKSGDFSNASNKGTSTKKCAMILTFNGTTWTLHNKTLGTVVAKTNTELGITAPLAPSTEHVQKVVSGHYHSTSTLAAHYPALYQLARWNRVLTQTEIDRQYAFTKAAFPTIGV